MNYTLKKIRTAGFSIVELIIIIGVVGILATIITISYTGILNSTREDKIRTDIDKVEQLIELYRQKNGHYPISNTSGTVISSLSNQTLATYDSECMFTSARSANWVPGITEELPQSDHMWSGGAQGRGGCYTYVSDGVRYVLSAWNMFKSPRTDAGYRRIGFREPGTTESAATGYQSYLCNHNNIGGRHTGSYVATNDMYKYSYTLTNIEDCDETPPSGA